MNLRDALRQSVRGVALSCDDAEAVFAGALSDRVDPVELGALLASMATRGETADEIAGAARALREAMIPFEHPFAEAIDTCGTGGDGLGLFNLSTAAAIVAASAGARVVKHGNRAASSKCGSADFLEAAGIPLELSGPAARAVLEEVGITFLFAPLHHPALKHASSVRKSLGVRTIFNWLGPLANPGRVRRQLLGVADGSRADSIAHVLGSLGVERAFVVHGAGRADELTLSGANVALPVGGAPIERFDADALGLEPAPNLALEGGDASDNVRLFSQVLDGARCPLADAIALNAAAALCVAGVAASAREGLEFARESIASRRAKSTFERWISTARRMKGAA